MGGSRINTAKLSLLVAAAGLVCPQLVRAQLWTLGSENKYAAKAVNVQGRVSVLRDGIEYAIEQGGEVRVKELIFTGPDGQAHFEVSDGSYFDVYPNSRVIFRKNTSDWRDLVDVLVGRIKVHIQHLGDQPNPNRVLTPTAVISVRGTTFEITVDDDDEATLVEVEEGTVEVRHALLPSNNPRILTTGESLKVYRNVPIATNRFDKMEVFKRVLRMSVDALSTYESRIPRGSAGGVAGTGGGTGGSTGSGDTKKPPPPTSAPGVPGAPPSPGAPPPSGGGFFSTNTTIYAHAQANSEESRWHRISHKVMHVIVKYALGETPEEQVIRAAGRQTF